VATVSDEDSKLLKDVVFIWGKLICFLPPTSFTGRGHRSAQRRGGKDMGSSGASGLGRGGQG
jgi:hypothetical protein